MEPSAKFTKSFRKEDVERDWYVVDAENQTVGRIATRIATILRGKHKPIFTPHVDTGDFVVVVNAEKVKLTGKRASQKEYFKHTGYIGNQHTTSFKSMMEKHPERVLEYAVKGMLPKNRLGRQMYKKLKVYAGENHPHEAQTPKELVLN
ncbi:MAG: 50S ribosomal protein L13 [Candidatus Kapaibacteriales bacterium]